ncbi:CesT family type III secretion system chaperone [Chitinimonas lacunae]|uniref:CesT family type III secretion system chaperone n=1 Tax=Chitinimonas lacunae TaxID=1963018 RepID=A0ABV8MN78_9NEIS
MNDFPRFTQLTTALAAVLALAELPADEPGICRLTIDGQITVHLFSADDHDLLLAARIGRLAADAPPALLWRLLQANQMDAPEQPFQLSLDQAGELLAWARWPIGLEQAERIADLAFALAELVVRWRGLLAEPEVEEGRETAPAGLALV